MEPTGIDFAAFNGKLSLKWWSETKPQAYLIHIATDSEFTENVRVFIVPSTVNAITLDIGQTHDEGSTGAWYLRIGSMIGTVNQGLVAWSGIYGPILLETQKVIIPIKHKSEFIHNTASKIGGYRIHMKSAMIAYYIFSTWRSDVPSITAKWTYFKDIGRGYADCDGFEYPHVYSVRIRKIDTLPTSTIEQFEDDTLFTDLTSQKPLAYVDAGQKSEASAGNAIIEDVKFRQNVRFSSHADYVRYQAALSKLR